MNTKTTTSQRIALATVVAGLALSTVACGSEQAVEPSPSSKGVAKTSPVVKGRGLHSPDAIERAAELRARRAVILQWERHVMGDQTMQKGTAAQRAADDRASRAEDAARAQHADDRREAHEVS